MSVVLTFIISFLRKAGITLLQAIMSEIFIKEFVIHALQKLANKTDNTVDDKIVKALKKAMKIEEDEQEDSKNNIPAD